MFICILDAAGEIRVHRNVKSNPEALLEIIAPFRDGLVVAAECTFTRYWLADLCARGRETRDRELTDDASPRCRTDDLRHLTPPGVIGVGRRVAEPYSVGTLHPVLRFEWDDAKNTGNKRKHRVSFEEAQTVFYDDRAILIEDEDENEDNEERFLLLGLSATMRLLVVCHCYRARDQVIRLISARRASRSELRDYESRWKR